MRKIIPRELVKHLEWVPGQAPPQQPTTPLIVPQQSSSFTLDDILNGKTFYSKEKSEDKYMGITVALQQALEYATPNGIVATMPELIAAKLKAEKTHEFWKK